jgi:hypothetical protein
MWWVLPAGSFSQHTDTGDQHVDGNAFEREAPGMSLKAYNRLLR